MKKRKLFVLNIVCMLFFIVSGCGNQKDDACEECILPSLSVGMSNNCSVASFMEGVSKYSKCINTYVIIGVVLDKYEYGLKISLAEDLKGNFPENVSEFIAWGDGSEGMVLERTDNLSMYHEQHELIMHLMPSGPFQYELPKGVTWLEKTGDFCTFQCTASVLLMLSNDKVYGWITSIEYDESRLQSMPWKAFYKMLNNVLKVK